MKKVFWPFYPIYWLFVWPVTPRKHRNRSEVDYLYQAPPARGRHAEPDSDRLATLGGIGLVAFTVIICSIAIAGGGALAGFVLLMSLIIFGAILANRR